MNFSLSEQQEAWRREVQTFFASAIDDSVRSELAERGDTFSPILWKRMAAAGYIGMGWPKAYGGGERDLWEQMLFEEEAALSGCPDGVISAMSDTCGLLGRIVLGHGSAEQKSRILPAAARGDLMSAEGLTEPNAGSDLASLETRAVRDGDDWVLNGAKVFNMAHLTTHFLVLARTDPQLPRHRGLSFFLMDMKSPGITVTPLMTMGRWRRNAVYFEDVRVPHSLLIGEMNRGWYYFVAPSGGLQTQVHTLSDAKFALNALVQYSRDERRDGVLLADIPWVRQSLGDLAASIEAANLLSWRIAWLNSNRQDATKEAAMAKLANSEVQERVLSIGLDILGTDGALESWGEDKSGVPLRGLFPHLYRDTRLWQIAGGTNQVKRNIIAQRGLGLPRD